MIISVASLTLRFYKSDGWDRTKIRELLVRPKTKITLRDSKETNGYYAVYEKSGEKVFKKSEMDKHTFDDAQSFGGVGWYIDEKR